MKILAFFAHPDDETIFLGGTLAFLAGQGAEIHYLCATRGEGGEMGDPPVCTREDLGQVREKELKCAVRELGGTDIQFLNYQDPLVGTEGELYPFADSTEELANLLQAELTVIEPEVVITHGQKGEYGHPAHIQAHEGMMLALSEIMALSPTIYAPSWLSRETGVFTPEPGILVDITPWKEHKTRAVSCHKSQHGLFLRHGASRAGRSVTIPEMIRTTEALYRVIPPWSDNGEDTLGKILKPRITTA